mmetsp:Transcript_36162/g.78227  ORF Transcript_36162/g.78227 Transcript_36162/m.78227 type:complete len:207 (+) Transcript_36162:1154-1774(+)
MLRGEGLAVSIQGPANTEGSGLVEGLVHDETMHFREHRDEVASHGADLLHGSRHEFLQHVFHLVDFVGLDAGEVLAQQVHVLTHNVHGVLQRLQNGVVASLDSVPDAVEVTEDSGHAESVWGAVVVSSVGILPLTLRENTVIGGCSDVLEEIRNATQHLPRWDLHTETDRGHHRVRHGCEERLENRVHAGEDPVDDRVRSGVLLHC